MNWELNKDVYVEKGKKKSLKRTTDFIDHVDIKRKKDLDGRHVMIIGSINHS